MSFFSSLNDLFFPPTPHSLMVRNMSPSVLQNLVTRRATFIKNISVTSLLPYRDPRVQALIIEAKYQNNRSAQKMLGVVLAEYIKELENAVLVPMPLGNARRTARGYNQVEEIATYAMQQLPLSLSITLQPKLIARIRETVPQTSLGKEARLANMRHAFGVAHALNPSHTYILFDDVVTTGATLAAAYETLVKAGASRLITLALAH